MCLPGQKIYGVESVRMMADNLNLFTADGSYVIAKDGNEYIKSVGAWEVTSLPGITARHIDIGKLEPEINWSGYASIHRYAGGVARGGNGAAGFIFEKDDRRKADGAGIVDDKYSKEIFGVKAHKSYFIMEDTVLCLGAGITDTRPELGSEIWTTMNQTKWGDDILYHKSGEAQVLKFTGENLSLVLKEKEAEGVEGGAPWVRQNGILYVVFPEYTSGEVRVSAEEKMSHWNLLNHANNSVENEPYRMFQLWINHGEKPLGERYAYLMYAGSMEPQDYLESSSIRILENSTKLQAVEGERGNLVEAVFYDRDALCKASGWSMKVSAPAVVMAELGQRRLKVTVNDPYQEEQLEKLKVCLTVPVEGDGVVEKDGWYIITVDMPGNPELGKPKTIVVDLK